jgi:hypothetical protein
LFKTRKSTAGNLSSAGTRVPFQTLLDYLEGGETLDEFLEQVSWSQSGERYRRAGRSKGAYSGTLREMKILIDKCFE